MSGKVTCEIANRLYNGIGQNWPQKLRLPSGYLILLELSKGSGLTDSWSKLVQDAPISNLSPPLCYLQYTATWLIQQILRHLETCCALLY